MFLCVAYTAVFHVTTTTAVVYPDAAVVLRSCTYSLPVFRVSYSLVPWLSTGVEGSFTAQLAKPSQTAIVVGQAPDGGLCCHGQAARQYVK